ncbi:MULTISPECIES: ABC transporter permease [Streptococcus]|uniref:ABC transporter permease n=1 Tax=Streptococcus TaxID=1301 RepID=UPI001C6FEAFE|nr:MULTISPECIES: ABC transporter permease [Streptococcus]
MILKLIHLETKKYQLKTYFLAIGIISLVILGFLYTFALIAYAGGEVDAIEFSTYENIWTLINALQTVAYAVLISVMFSTFIIKEYARKLNLLLFTYPVDKSTLLKAKVLLVAFIGIGGMLLGSALIFLIFFISERIFPLVPDTFSFGNIIKIWSELLLCSVYALCVGIVATKIGFIKMSVQTTIVSAIIIASCSANVISTMSYTNFPFLFLWGIMAIISIISYCNIVHKTIRMDI